MAEPKPERELRNYACTDCQHEWSVEFERRKDEEHGGYGDFAVDPTETESCPQCGSSRVGPD
jgi:hypothetical protein